MERLIKKYADKMVRSGLAENGEPLLAGLDAEITWNREASEREELQKLFGMLSINSLLFSKPAEPYASIVDYVAQNSGGSIRPSDCETRTFLHELPVIEEFSAAEIGKALSARKCAVIPGRGIVTFGTVSPEQAFVVFSSACFACFVKFFSDYLTLKRENKFEPGMQRVFDLAVPMLDELPDETPTLMSAPFSAEEDVYAAISEAGRMTVKYKLVDSFFGNVSYLKDNVLYISQTGSSLDEMEGFIDPVPLDGSSCSGMTASSELSAHREIVEKTNVRAILHGHPKFSVILSMDCEKKNCPVRGECHLRCPEKRLIADIPVVPGEVGTGPTGLCNTLPPAVLGRRGAIVYGHGLFTTGEEDFNIPFKNLLEIEKMCREEYFNRTGQPR